MTPELYWLTLAGILAGSLWIPFILGVTSEKADFTDFTRPPDLTLMRPWVHRAFRAHQNMLETFTPFAAIVLVAHFSGISTAWTKTAVIAFFWIRIAHALGMISGLAVFPVRPIIFSASWVCTLIVAGHILAS